MTAYIERIITQVEVQPEQQQNADDADNRWLEIQKIESALKRQQQLQYRTQAEGMDD